MIRIHPKLKRAAFFIVTLTLLMVGFVFSAGAAQTGYVDGSSVRVRTAPTTESEIVTTLRNGDALDILDSGSSGWYQISRTGAEGNTVTGYISRELVRIAPMVNRAGVTQTATVLDDGVLLCSMANAASATELSLAEGTVVTLLSSDNELWQLVEYTAEDQRFTGYLPADSVALAPMAIGYINSDDTQLYTAASFAADTGVTFTSGTMVYLMDAFDGWYQVSTDIGDGYIWAHNITASYDYSKISHGTATGDGLRVRETADPQGKVLTTMKEGVAFQITSDAVDGWYATRYNGKTGYISADFVSLTDPTGGYVQVTSPTLNLMSGAGNSFSVMAEIEQGTVLTIEGVFGNWYLVSYDHFNGFINSAYTSATTKNGYYDGVNGSNIGAQIAAYACQFNGNPYQWGGTSLTHGADCSGFVLKVYQQFGVSLPHSSAAMRGVGRSVSYSEMQPGDIVCYSGHVGIYAGGGKIINALGEKWGITYTNVNYKPIITIRRIFG